MRIIVLVILVTSSYAILLLSRVHMWEGQTVSQTGNVLLHKLHTLHPAMCQNVQGKQKLNCIRNEKGHVGWRFIQIFSQEL